jgi:hypothetical protein
MYTALIALYSSCVHSPLVSFESSENNMFVYSIRYLFSPPSGLVCCLALYALKVNGLFSKSARFPQILQQFRQIIKKAPEKTGAAY